MRKSVIRRKTPQDVTDRRKTVTSQNAYSCAAVVDLEVTINILYCTVS